MRLINLDGAQTVQHPEHGAAEAGPDGVFDVPTLLGHALLADRGHWTTEADHVAAQAQEALTDLADPKKVPHVLLELRTRIAGLEAELAAMREQPPADEPAPTVEDGESPAAAAGEPELTRQQKAAATRAAKKAAETPAAPDA